MSKMTLFDVAMGQPDCVVEYEDDVIVILGAVVRPLNAAETAALDATYAEWARKSAQIRAWSHVQGEFANGAWQFWVEPDLSPCQREGYRLACGDFRDPRKAFRNLGMEETLPPFPEDEEEEEE